MFILKESDTVGKYRVSLFIKEGVYNSTYRVETEDGKSYFMKLYDSEMIPPKLKTEEGVLEIVGCRKINHENVVSYVDDGVYESGGREYPYLITEFFHGRLLSEYLREGVSFGVETSKQIISGVLKGLDHIHSLEMNHNDITPRNIILDEIEKDKYIPRIIDLGHLCGYVGGAPPFPVRDLNLLYCSPEQFVGEFGSRGDVFAAAALLYTLITGKAPWEVEIDESLPYVQKKAIVREARKNPLDTDALLKAGADQALVDLILCALEDVPRKRLNLQDFIAGISGEASFTPPEKEESEPKKETPEGGRAKKEESTVSVSFKKSSGGGGFADVAGMEALKEDLTRRVIWVLKDKEKAERYRLLPPNGMVLYGPPGCGKTFFAQKFAEEAGFNFTMVNGSDLGSIYVHGTQGKIADLFKKARENTPAILCFDEFDAFVPSRGSSNADHKADEVNEFLSQLNNCAKDGLFVIGTTNRLDMIDPAVLRKGRMDLHVEIPAPDKETRRKIFDIHLKGRPLAADIDTDLLAEKTPNYASSDIAFIVNEAAMMAALADQDISQSHLLHSVESNPSSLVPVKSRPKIGF